MRLPQRLEHGQDAELVDHLDELRVTADRFGDRSRGRVRRSRTSCHARLVAMLESPLPAGKKLVTFGVAEPFLTSLQVSLVGGDRGRAADRAVAALELLRSGGRSQGAEGGRVVRRRSRPRCSPAASRSATASRCRPR